jgi:polar amino acid transport system substrate-binding protein
LALTTAAPTLKAMRLRALSFVQITAAALRRTLHRATTALAVCALTAGTIPAPLWAALPEPAAATAATPATRAAAPAGGEVWRVGVRATPPFCIQDAGGRWGGLAIELWETVAQAEGIAFSYEPAPIRDLLAGLQDGRFDITIGSLSMTAERERVVDFLHPFLTTGLAIAARADTTSPWLVALGRLVSWEFAALAGALLLLLSAIGAAVWWCERRANAEQFGGTPLEGIGSGLWFSAVTMTTVGYGDKAPRTFGGRAVSFVWMFAALILVSSFTGALASLFTVSTLTSEVRGLDDLSRVPVAVVAGSTAEQFLREREVGTFGMDSPEAAMAALRRGEVKAVVHDAPILRHLAARERTARIKVLPELFEPQFYAFAVAEADPRREKLNRRLLEILAEPDWVETRRRWLDE